MPDSRSIRREIVLSDYVRRARFGLAADRLGLSGPLLEECVDQKYFAAAEMPLEYWSGLTEARRERLGERFRPVQCGNLLPPSLAALIPEAAPRLRRDFVRVCGQLFRRLETLDVTCGALDFSLNAGLQNEPQRQKLASLLRELHPLLLATGRTLLLPLRLPSADTETALKAAAFLRELMISGLKLRLDLHPHALKRGFNPVELAGTLRLETRSVMFCVNADSGNKLLSAHILPWLEYFAPTGFSGPYLFCPFSYGNRLAAAESENCSRLTEELAESVPPRTP